MNENYLRSPAQPHILTHNHTPYTPHKHSCTHRGMTTWELPEGYGRVKPDILAYGHSVLGLFMCACLCMFVWMFVWFCVCLCGCLSICQLILHLTHHHTTIPTPTYTNMHRLQGVRGLQGSLRHQCGLARSRGSSCATREFSTRKCPLGCH